MSILVYKTLLQNIVLPFVVVKVYLAGVMPQIFD